MFNRGEGSRFLRFCTVGLGNTAIDIFCFFVLTVSGVPYLAAQITAYSAGMVNSYICNRHWTFRMRSRSDGTEMLRFLAVNLVSLGFSSLILFACYDIAQQALWISKLIATGGGVLLNYAGSHRWVFRPGGTRVIHQ